MNKNVRTQLIGILATISLITQITAFAQVDLDRSQPTMPDPKTARGRVTRGADSLDKLSPELRTLYEQFTPTRGAPQGADETGIEGYTSGQLSSTFGIMPGDMNPLLTIAVNFTSKTDLEALKKAGVTVVSQMNKTVYVVTTFQQIANIAGMESVSSIGVLTATRIPSPTRQQDPQIASLGRGGIAPTAEANKTMANRFNRQGMTGKGVIVGVVDTGIDWRHEDFIRPDGTSRILAIWDPFDDSYLDSNGSIGSEPPVISSNNQTKRFGTVYTNQQINAALAGKGKVNTFDRFGHGTAVAGTAASNGRATAKDIPVGTYDGVAPEADLIIVRASDCGSFLPFASVASGWIADMAKSLNRPVVINMSFGGQFSAHDGTTDAEKFIDGLTGPGKPGRVITVSAGNDGQYSLHSSGKFGPKRVGQKDNFSDPVELFVKAPSSILAVLDTQDDWGVAFRSNNEIFQGADGKPTPIYIYKEKGQVSFNTGSTMKHSTEFAAFMNSLGEDLANPGGTSDVIDLRLPEGHYFIWGYGSTDKVRDGKFDLYSVEPAYLNQAVFGMGTEKTGMVGSPGNAKNAITVGSYDFRDSWVNLQGETAFYNLTLGGPSSYSSPGFRRDGLVKPDITAPARYTISPLSQSAKPDSGGCKDSMASGDGKDFTKDGYHIAWDGTSAAAPFTAGVIALMFQKNPNLDAEQIRQILRKTARKDGSVGAVPNAVWGWGMIDPAAAIAATPPSTPVRKPVKAH
jgi:minor extracellular serine protease Vpr